MYIHVYTCIYMYVHVYIYIHGLMYFNSMYECKRFGLALNEQKKYLWFWGPGEHINQQLRKWPPIEWPRSGPPPHGRIVRSLWCSSLVPLIFTVCRGQCINHYGLINVNINYCTFNFFRGWVFPINSLINPALLSVLNSLYWTRLILNQPYMIVVYIYNL